MPAASEFRTENRVPWRTTLTRVAPAILAVALAAGVGTLRFDPKALPLLIATVAAALIIGYFAFRSLLEQRRTHIKISSDWIRIRRGSRILSAPLHAVVIERSLVSRRRYRISHARGRPAFTISLDQFPQSRRDALAGLLNAHARPEEGLLGDLTGIDRTTPR